MAAHSAGSVPMACCDGLAVAHIEADGVNGLGAALEGRGGDLGEFVGAAGGQQQARSLGGEGQRRGRANARGGSGDEDEFSLESHASILTRRHP